MDFQKGDAGSLVAQIQTALISFGYLLMQQATGYFGDATETAIKNFQLAKGLEADGIVGLRTLHFLGLDFSAFQPNGKDKSIDWILPASDFGFTTYNRENGGRDQFATKATIDKILTLSAGWTKLSPVPIQYGDMSRRHGGAFPPHQTHTDGRCADARPFRLDGKALPTDCRTRGEYDGATTQMFIDYVKSVFPGTKFLFNDKTCIEKGLSRFCAGHYNHLHIIF